MEGTRLRILQHLQKSVKETVDGLAVAIGLAPATIRRHLDILQRDRLVAFREVRKKTGRPEYSYYLTEAGHESLPKGYDKLLGMLVHEMSSLTPKDTHALDGDDILRLVFRRLSSRVSERYDDELAGRGIAHRLATLMGHLEREAFFPEAEVAGGSLRIKLLNCPFRSVALASNTVCTFDLNLIGSILDVDITRQQCIHDGDTGCMYTADLGEKQVAALSS